MLQSSILSVCVGLRYTVEPIWLSCFLEILTSRDAIEPSFSTSQENWSSGYLEFRWVWKLLSWLAFIITSVSSPNRSHYLGLCSSIRAASSKACMTSSALRPEISDPIGVPCRWWYTAPLKVWSMSSSCTYSQGTWFAQNRVCCSLQPLCLCQYNYARFMSLVVWELTWTMRWRQRRP